MNRMSNAPGGTPAVAADPAGPVLGDMVWVLDDPRARAAMAPIAIAERLGVPHRRIPLSWNWLAALAPVARHGSLMGLTTAGRGAGARRHGTDAAAEAFLAAAAAGAPRLILAAGARAGAVALWLRRRLGTPVVQWAGTDQGLGAAGLSAGALAVGALAGGLAGARDRHGFDLLVVNAPPPGRGGGSAAGPDVMAVLGVPHRISPALLRQSERGWRERLAHLPRPRIALMMTTHPPGNELPPAAAHGLARAVARAANMRGGSILASAGRHLGTEATDALSAGLGSAMHILHRWNEPEADPSLGFLATADAIVVAAGDPVAVSEACATAAPVFIALPDLAGRRERRILAALRQAGHVRPLSGDLQGWPRRPLDEAGRIAAEIRRRISFD